MTRDDDTPWTPAEGARDVIRFLAHRAPAGTAVWLALGGLALLWANAGAVGAGGFGSFGILMALVGALAGGGVGVTLVKGLPDAIHFAGWIPIALSGAVCLGIVGGGWVVLTLSIGLADDHLGALVLGGAMIGALGAVLRFVWAES